MIALCAATAGLGARGNVSRMCLATVSLDHIMTITTMIARNVSRCPMTDLTWTEVRPTRANEWYWYRPTDSDPLIVYVDTEFTIEQGQWHVSELLGQWSSAPIAEPREGA